MQKRLLWTEFCKALKKILKKINKKSKKKRKLIKKNKIMKIKQRKFMKKKRKKKKNRFRNPLNKKIKVIYRWISREINFFNMSPMNKWSLMTNLINQQWN